MEEHKPSKFVVVGSIPTKCNIFMIQMGTILNVVDNSGAKTVICIKTSKGFKSNHAKLGNTVLVSVRTLRGKRKLNLTIHKGDICKALIIKTKVIKRNLYGESTRFLDNGVVLLTKQNKFLFSRVFGLIPNIIRYTKYMRIVSLSAGLIK